MSTKISHSPSIFSTLANNAAYGGARDVAVVVVKIVTQVAMDVSISKWGRVGGSRVRPRSLGKTRDQWVNLAADCGQ